MGDNPTPEGATQVKVGYLQLSEQERKVADAVVEQTKSYLVSGFKDAIAEAKAAWEKETDPRTRPGFSGSSADPRTDEVLEVDIKRFGAVSRAVVSKASGQTIGWADAGAQPVSPDHALGETKGGYLPAMQMSPDNRRALAQDFAGYVSELASKGEKAPSGVSFNVLKFPLGGIENYSICRWAMAVERSQNTSEGTAAFAKWAPWESAYYAALEGYAATKAQGDMVSGQDGGFLAPELWATSFIDQIHPASAVSRLPITRIPMGNRVVHVPRLSANIQINYSSENAALTANQAQFQQVSFTARKQAAFVQISNELIRDSNPAAMTILQQNAAKYMAWDQDWQILLGNGLAGTPVGLYNQTNVTKGNGTNGGGFGSAGTLPSGLGTNSKFPTIGDLTTAIFNVEDLNGSTNVPIGQANCTGIVGPVILKLGITSATNVELVSGGTDQRPLYDFGYNQARWANRLDGSSSLDNFLGVSNWVLSNIVKKSLTAGSGGASAAPTSVTTNPLNSPPSTTTMVLNNMSPVFFGDWQHLWVMERQDVELLTSNVAGTAFANDQTWVRLIRRYDVGVAHPEPFFVATNA